MAQYRITQTRSGLDMGIFTADTPEQAIEAMLKDGDPSGDTYKRPDDGLIAEETNTSTDYLNNDRNTNMFVASVINEERGRVGNTQCWDYYAVLSAEWANILSLYA